jgi:hypothetical protein
MLTWPANDASDVPTDTSIVMDGYGAVFVSALGAHQRRGYVRSLG